MLIEVNGEGLMTRSKIKYLASLSMPAASAAEHFTALEPTDEHLLVWLGNTKGFSVHFGIGEFNVFRDAFNNGVGGVHHPEAFLLTVLTVFSPLQKATCAHETHKWLGHVTGVQYDESHAFKHALLYPCGILVCDLVVRGVSPPGHYIGVIQDIVTESLFRAFQL